MLSTPSSISDKLGIQFFFFFNLSLFISAGKCGGSRMSLYKLSFLNAKQNTHAKALSPLIIRKRSVGFLTGKNLRLNEVNKTTFNVQEVLLLALPATLLLLLSP